MEVGILKPFNARVNKPDHWLVPFVNGLLKIAPYRTNYTVESIPYSLRVLFSHALRKVLVARSEFCVKVIDLYRCCTKRNGSADGGHCRSLRLEGIFWITIIEKLFRSFQLSSNFELFSSFFLISKEYSLPSCFNRSRVSKNRETFSQIGENNSRDYAV